jgi:hypothetical protein
MQPLLFDNGSQCVDTRNTGTRDETLDRDLQLFDFDCSNFALLIETSESKVFASLGPFSFI